MTRGELTRGEYLWPSRAVRSSYGPSLVSSLPPLRCQVLGGNVSRIKRAQSPNADFEELVSKLG